MWDTSDKGYNDLFAETWAAFSKNPIIPLNSFNGKRVCFDQFVFSLPPRLLNLECYLLVDAPSSSCFYRLVCPSHRSVCDHLVGLLDPPTSCTKCTDNLPTSHVLHCLISESSCKSKYASFQDAIWSLLQYASHARLPRNWYVELLIANICNFCKVYLEYFFLHVLCVWTILIQ